MSPMIKRTCREEQTSVDELQVVLQKVQTPYHRLCDTSDDMFWDAVMLQLLQAPCIHIFHAVVDARLDEESAIELDNFRCNCSMQNIQLHDNSIEFCFFELKSNFLPMLVNQARRLRARR